ncbi:MAG: amino acid permease [Verrucomicrobia bacterium]|nr:amino acid permease [Verrucomicrobiota bacterium]
MNSAPPAAGEHHPHLQRRLGVLQATALNMTNMIGIGPFITIPALMSALNGPHAMLGWLVAVLITVPDALVWSELGAAMPGSGGSYVYLREGFGRHTFGRFMAFLFVWQFILSGPLEIASGLIGFAQYLNYLLPGMTAEHSPINAFFNRLWQGIAPERGLSLQGGLTVVTVGALCIVLLYRKITSIGKITVSLWAGTLLTTLAVIVTGALHFNPKIAFDFPAEGLQFSLGFFLGLGAATRVGVYDYLGYYDVCYVGEEVRDPGKVIPRSILISIVGVALIYVLINLSIIGVVPWREFVPATDPPAPVVSMFMEKIYGSKVATVFTLMVLWTAFGSVFALMLGYSRIPYAAAKDGCFFKVFSRLHETKDFPHVSLLLVGIISILCSFLPLMTVIDALLVTRIVVQFIGQCIAVMLLRKRAPELARPYRMWLYPLPPLVALAGWVFLFATADVRLMKYGGLTLLLGVVFFLVWTWLTKRWPFAKAEEGRE